MTIPVRDLASQVADPSVGVLVYHCETLRELLRDLDEQSSDEARRLRDVLEVYLDAVQQALWQIHTGCVPPRPLSPSAAHDVVRLTTIVRDLYMFVRYIKGHPAGTCQPCVQAAVRNLLHRTWKATDMGCEATEVVAFIRGQWNYNYTFADLLEHLEKIAPSAQLIDKHFPRSSRGAFVQHMWGRRRGVAPRRITMLSYPRLDSDDTLLAPLLAHELAHVIDFNHAPSLSQRRGAIPADWVAPGTPESLIHRIDARPVHRDMLKWIASASEEQVPAKLRRAVAAKLTRENASYDGSRVVQTAVELTADLLALRMMGVSYFVALAELLKTLHVFPDAMIIRTTGYPGPAFRLRVLFDELFHKDGIALRSELDALVAAAGDATSPRGRMARRFVEYIERWGKRLDGQYAPWQDEAGDDAALNVARRHYDEYAVQRSVRLIRPTVRAFIPRDRVPRLDMRVLDLAADLEARRAPISAGPRDSAFADILTAAWMYQLEFGDDRELKGTGPTEQAAEYWKTCGLVRDGLSAAFDCDLVETTSTKR